MLFCCSWDSEVHAMGKELRVHAWLRGVYELTETRRSIPGLRPELTIAWHVYASAGSPLSIPLESDSVGFQEGNWNG